MDPHFPDVPVSKSQPKSHGQGQGRTGVLAARVHPGRIRFEIDGVNEETAREALRLGAAKLPVRTRVVARITE